MTLVVEIYKFLHFFFLLWTWTPPSMLLFLCKVDIWPFKQTGGYFTLYGGEVQKVKQKKGAKIWVNFKTSSLLSRIYISLLILSVISFYTYNTGWKIESHPIQDLSQTRLFRFWLYSFIGLSLDWNLYCRRNPTSSDCS